MESLSENKTDKIGKQNSKIVSQREVTEKPRVCTHVHKYVLLEMEYITHSLYILLFYHGPTSSVQFFFF